MATAPSPGREVVRFGACEADLRAGDLRKQSLRIGLPDSPLAIFLEHPGGVVAREDLPSRTRGQRGARRSLALAPRLSAASIVCSLCAPVCPAEARFGPVSAI
jgi:hypothetical protein